MNCNSKEAWNQQNVENNKLQECYSIYMVTWYSGEGSLEVVFLDLKQRYKFSFTKLLLKYTTIALTTLIFENVFFLRTML